MDDIKKIQIMKNAMKCYSNRNMFKHNVKPRLFLNPTSLNIAYILCCIVYTYILVNFNEVSKLQKKYLTLWSSNQTHPYITSIELMSKLGLSSYSIFVKFFLIYDSRIDFNVFFMFLYTFAFCPYEHLVKLLLCSCGINPSTEITVNQLSQFLSYFQTGYTNFSWNEYDESTTLFVDDVCDILQGNTNFKSFIYMLKRTLVKEIIDSNLYLEILNRIRIFKGIDLHILGSKVSETNCEVLNRILFTNKSSPFKSDYRKLLNEQNHDSPQIITIFNVLYDIIRLYPLHDVEDKSYKKSNEKEYKNSFISLKKVMDFDYEEEEEEEEDDVDGDANVYYSENCIVSEGGTDINLLCKNSV